MRKSYISVAVAALVATVSACGGGGSAPVLAPLEDQTVAVGAELTLVISGSDSDVDDLSYSFSSLVPGIEDRATMTHRPDGTGLFRWRPIAEDVGIWDFDFSASDGNQSDTVTIQIAVKSAVGANSAPVFREPLGTGTTLDLEVSQCVETQIVIDDQDSTSVVIAQEEPSIAGSSIEVTSGLTAIWRWCPGVAQVSGENQYTLRLSADDGSNPKTIKHYLIVLRKPPKPGCSGNPPVVSHTSQNVDSLVGITVEAGVTDDLGLKTAPLFYYASSQPSNPPNLSSMTQLSMALISGDMRNGRWTASLPNPVVDASPGTSATIYYLMVASDNDDLEGDCDHHTQSPSYGTYSMVVTNPGGDGGAGLCDACTSDVQCGGPGDLCVRVGVGAESFCLQACTTHSDCPDDYFCSPITVESVGMASGRQCIPLSSDCSDPGGIPECADDSYEDNDSRAQAEDNPVLAPGNYELMSCPAEGSGDDEDWFKITVAADAQVTLTLNGGTASDLDLRLYDANGAVVGSSVSLTSMESITGCFTAGTYYVRAYAFGAADNAYTLNYTSTAMSCTPPVTCSDDELEDDDNATSARMLSFDDIYPMHVSQTNGICANDEDWYAISLVNGDTITVDLTFEQTMATEDLDLHFYNSAVVDLTPCLESAPSTCSDAQGQSATSNEHYTFTLADETCTISSQCRYYIVVHGWEGAENLYDIQIALTFP